MANVSVEGSRIMRARERVDFASVNDGGKRGVEEAEILAIDNDGKPCESGDNDGGENGALAEIVEQRKKGQPR